MNLADVNVLLPAFRSGHKDHGQCRAWLDGELARDRFAVSPQVLSSVIRIATNRRVYRDPSPPAEVLAFSEALLRAPSAVIVEPRERHWAIFSGIVANTAATGDMVPDAWFAALAIEWGCTFVTLDRALSRVPGLITATP